MAFIGTSSAQAGEPPKPVAEGSPKLPALLSAKPVMVDPKDDEVRKLLKMRYNEAVSELRAYYADFSQPGDRIYTLDELYERWGRLLRAGLELCGTSSEKEVLLTEYVKIAKEIERDQQGQYDAGRVRMTELHRARYERLDAEIQLYCVKREAAKGRNK
jgi:hypothetical protein